jgi:phosphatidylserine decarboxylase
MPTRPIGYGAATMCGPAVYQKGQNAMKATTGSSAPFRVGEWLSSDQAFLDRWLAGLIGQTHSDGKPLHPVIADFRDFIENDPQIFMLFHQMFDEVPKKTPYNKDPTGRPQVRDYHQMLRLLNAILTHAPEFDESGLVGCPINAILDWPMGTPAGFAAFLNDRVNAQLKRILTEWSRFLSSGDSAHVLSDHPRRGWFGADAQRVMPNFCSEYRCDPRLPHHGFKSWDDFFTREFRAGLRPVAEPHDSSIIVNACESAPYRIARQVKLHDRFWIKSQPYSIVHMLANDGLAAMFIGGTIYQAYLSPLSYHRWHSPVDGRVTKTYVKDGTYFSEAPSEGFDPAGPNDSQGYITAVATRALVFIESDNPKIGMMCFLGVGMSEVSSCEITAYEGQRVRKGDQIGMFHFGGSTHCLIFQPGVELEFDLHGQTPGLHSSNIEINSPIATVSGR